MVVVVVHFGLLGGVILFVHHPIAFLGRFLMFLGFTQAYESYQAPLMIKEALLERFATDPPDLNDFSLLTLEVPCRVRQFSMGGT